MFNENIALRKIKYFNEEPEDVIYLENIGDFIYAVTRKIELNHYGNLTKITLNGYELTLYRNTLEKFKSFIELVAESRYDAEHKHLTGLYIRDFLSNESKRDCGYGSIMMEKFVEYAKTLKVQYIAGSLSFVDIGTDDKRTAQQVKNLERLHHFYPKHGFKINGNGGIRLQLNNS